MFRLPVSVGQFRLRPSGRVGTKSRSQGAQGSVERGEVGAPLRLVARDARQPGDDGPALLQRLARLGVATALSFQQTDLVAGRRQVALPFEAEGIALSQHLGYLQTLAIG